MLRIELGARHFYRCLAPKWACLPLSGVGAASTGGRFNRLGIEALHLSAEPDTALAEYEQGSSLPRPATLAAYELDLTDVVDLSAGYDPDRWAAPWQAGIATGAGSLVSSTRPRLRGSSATRRSDRGQQACCSR